VLVDGGSTDRTAELARELAAGDERFRVVEAGEASPGRGRNIGASEARYPWLAFTDAGIGLDPEWLEGLAEQVERDPTAEVVYGNFEPVTSTFFERCAAIAYVSPRVPHECGAPLRGRFIASALMRRDVWRRAGGFPDLRAAEDLIFMERVEALGSRTKWAPRAYIWWQLQPDLPRTFRRFALYSKHNVWAGRQRFWHYGIARQYLLALPFVVLALLHSAWWLLVPALGLAARAAKSVWRHRDGRGLLWALNPLQFACVVLVLLTIDLATFLGWAQALLTRPAPGAAARGTVA
jgi:glycosyltransferase involved in cell wall biosynthesis